MPRAPASFRQADVSRVLRAIVQAGVRAEVKIKPDGTIRIIPVDHKPAAQPAAEKRRIVL